ncbi:acyltransferase family protein [Arsukibacterium sp.]|uniref:acyltransferase family protein n=1 Tax=Arsukibacterium sp. TaxID=1977258 RepID=UPI00261FDA66|nr:acyltransferase family protein [Arsukibacterium sp.]
MQAKWLRQARGQLWSWLARPPAIPGQTERICSVDLARGIAVALMILSHSVIGMLSFDELPGYGQIPIHLITKFSSSTFVMVFGIALAVAFLPRVGTKQWPRLRLKLLLSGVVVFFWYKVLTVAEMLYLFQPADIVDTLLYRDFPSFVEILGFYAFALMWVPFLLPLWRRTPLILRLLSPAALALLGVWVADNVTFWGSQQLRAIFVEDDDYYVWGQLTRGPLVLLGLLIGEALLWCHGKLRWRLSLAGALLLVSSLLFLSLWWLASPELAQALALIAANVGKHPPDLPFMLFSMAGAFLIIGLCVAGGPLLSKVLYPLTVIGSNALQAFIFHIVVIFVGFRYLMGYWQNVEYHFVLMLTLGLILATAVWIKLVEFVKVYR